MRTARWLPVVVAAAASVAGAAVAAAVVMGEASAARVALVAVGLLIGWSFLWVGALAWRRRPDSPVGALLCAVGVAWFVSGLWLSQAALLHTLGVAATDLYYAVLVHMLLAFPDGRLGRAERVLVGAGYLAGVGLQVAAMPFLDSAAVLGCACPPNLLLVRRDDEVARLLLDLGELAGLVVLVVVVGLLIRRWRAAGHRPRRALEPVLAAGVAVLGLVAASLGADRLTTAGQASGAGRALLVVSLVALAAVPYAFLAGLARSRLSAAGAVGTLLERLAAAPGTGELRAAVSSALGDPSVAVAYWLPDRGQHVDEDGRPVELPAPGSGRAVLPVERGAQRVGVVVHDAALPAEPGLLGRVGAAAALALENERLGAELRARVRELERSRAEVVATGDAERRRLERDLHDGAQQRLVAVRLSLGLARAELDGSPGGRLLDEAATELDAALSELRELARGLHPSVLATRGLAAAVEGLAARSPVPVKVDVEVGRLPAPLEAAAYFVVAEGLTNVAKHARADTARVRVLVAAAGLLVEVSDDGRGGADPRGSGLLGLAARVAALEGTLVVADAQCGGTVLRAALPLPSAEASS